MKVNASRFYTFLFGAVLVLQVYLPSFKANVFIQIAVICLFVFFEKPKVGRIFANSATPAILIFFLGFVGTLIHSYNLFNILKDIFHFIKPILGLTIGYLLYRKINDFRLFIKAIVILGLLSALTHFAILLFFSDTQSISGIRQFGKDNFMELFALFFLGYYKKFRNDVIFLSKTVHYIIFVLLLLSNILYFSRTMTVVAIILLMSVHGYTIITKNTLKISGVVLLTIVALYAYLFSIKIDRNAPGFMNFLYKVKIAPEELFETRIDRENHADLWDHWRGYEAKRAFALMNKSPSSYVFGCGYGSLVNLKFYAPLTGDVKDKGMKFISELHNGYAYLLYKTGIIGLLIYLGFLLKLYRSAYGNRSIESVFMSAIGLIFFFTTLTITGIYNNQDVIIFILGALLFFAEKHKTETTANPAHNK